MHEVSYEQLMMRAERAAEIREAWHFHYVPLRCTFTHGDELHRIVLEVRGKGPIYAVFDYEPRAEIQMLHDLFMA